MKPIEGAGVAGAERAEGRGGGEDGDFVAEATGAKFLSADAAGEEESEG